MKNYLRVEVTSRAQWRGWLADHHGQAAPIWLVTFKKHDAGRHLSYDAVVEEALCFGWVDSLPRSLDANRSMRLLAPRKPGSTWSAANRSRVARLIAAKAMTPAGLAKVDRAKHDGSWNRLMRAETGRAPNDLDAALRLAGATAGWISFSLAVRRRLIEQLEAAKRPPTRAARIAAIVAGADAGVDPLDWRARHTAAARQE